MDLFVYTAADPDATLPADVMERYRKGLEEEVRSASERAWADLQRQQHRKAELAADRAHDEEQEAKRLYRQRSART